MQRSIIAMALVLMFSASTALATSTNKNVFVARYSIGAESKLNSCITCHTSSQPSFPFPRNPYGEALGDLFPDPIGQRLAAIENDDSDGDGVINITEITVDVTFPGDADDVPVDGSSWGSVKSLFR